MDMQRQWWTDIGYEKTVADCYRIWKDSGGLISGMEIKCSTDIGYGMTVVDLYRVWKDSG